MVMLHSTNFSESSAVQEPLAVDSTITGHSWMLNVTGMVTVVAERAALVVLSAVFASCILPPNFYSLNLREPSSPGDNLKNPKYLSGPSNALSSGSCALINSAMEQGQSLHGIYNLCIMRIIIEIPTTTPWNGRSLPRSGLPRARWRLGRVNCIRSFDDGALQTVWASPSMLQDFLSLDGKPPQAFANYAKTWGMLDIRDDGEGWELSMSSIFVHP